MKRLALIAALTISAASTARAQDLKDRFNGRVTLMGMGLFETQKQNMPNMPQLDEASRFRLGWGDARILLDGRRLPGNFELHVDGRIRMSGELGSDSVSTAADTPAYSRGYVGGREYEVREVYARRRGAKLDFAIGRMFVSEADGLKIDGLRGWWRFAKHWDGTLFVGSMPNPYSRSILSDYVSGGPTVAGGATFSYTYDRIWGKVGAIGSYLGGNDDGGVFIPTAAMTTGTPKTELTRSFVTWTNYWRAASWLEIYSDLVLDVAGAAGVQVTRANVFATGRFGPAMIRLGYNRNSSYAIEMYLLNLLANRGQYLPGTIENNLVVMRTARDEGRLDADVTLKKTSIYLNAAIRRRYSLQVGDDSSFAIGGDSAAPPLAYDATLGVRDRGSLAGLRMGAAVTYLGDYRARNVIAKLDLGRSFANDKFGFDLYFAYALSKDATAGLMATCANVVDPMTMTLRIDPAHSCFGRRDGGTYEVGLTLTSVPWRKIFLLGDYRFVADTMSGPANAILTHVLMLRLEFRF